jgi:hypothetical protein
MSTAFKSRSRHLYLLIAATAVAATLLGCGAPKTPVPTVETFTTIPEVTLFTARRQTSFITLPIQTRQGTLTITPVGDSTFDLATLRVFQIQQNNGSITSPATEQFFGQPIAITDRGSRLTAALPQTIPGRWKLPDVGPIELEITIPTTTPPGDYHLTGYQVAPVHIRVADLTLPMQPATIALATTRTDILAAAYPQTWGAIEGSYLDRGDAAQRAAVAQLDALVSAAQRHGVNLYVENLMPIVTVDNVGRVSLDWRAYDRTVAPWMDGSPFDNKIGLAAWLVPAPPRRIADTPAQLRQYWQQCITHARDHGWTTTPVLLHPALLDPNASTDRIEKVLTVLKNDVDSQVAVVCRPGIKTDQPMLWSTDEGNALPETGALATPESVRVWPWMTQARHLAGFVWRHAATADSPSATPSPAQSENTPDAIDAEDASGEARTTHALFTLSPAGPLPTLRLTWLTDGLNDIAHFGLLQHRADPAVVGLVLAGVVGRTGLPPLTKANEQQTWDIPTPRFLAANWPTGNRTWSELDAMIDVLTVAGTPGSITPMSPDDPLYLRTQEWIAAARRPAARLAAYRFSLTPSRGDSLLRVTPDLIVENPHDQPLQLATVYPTLPERWDTQSRGSFTVEANQGFAVAAPIAVYLDALPAPVGPLPIDVREQGGPEGIPVASVLAPIPVRRMRSTTEPPTIDGHFKDWPADNPSIFGAMRLQTPYLNRPIIQSGTYAALPSAAAVQWQYDADYIYALIRCPQPQTDDQRNTDWPTLDGRWWNADGVQIQLAGGLKIIPGQTRIVTIAIKPSGIVQTRQCIPDAGQPLTFTDGPTGLRSAVLAVHDGYIIELAIPRKWFPTDHDADPNIPAWRVNVLRHVHDSLRSSSWSGPLLDDADIGMMGALIGE